MRLAKDRRLAAARGVGYARDVFRTAWLKAFVARAMLVAALVAFLVPALAGSFSTVCVCLGDGQPVAVGACCCERPDDAGCEPGTLPEPTSAPGAHRHDADTGDVPCACVDLCGSSDPTAPDRRADPPVAAKAPPAHDAPFALAPRAAVRSTAAPERPPPDVASSAPRVLRC